MKLIITMIIAIAVLLGFGLTWLLLRESNVNSFSECQNAGYRVTESVPRQCITSEGKIFVDPNQTASDTLGLSDTNMPEGFKYVEIQFPRIPKSTNQFAYTEAVPRGTNESDLIEFALRELSIGPEEGEKDQGFYSPLKFKGDSDCNNKDMSYQKDDNTGLTVVHFCRALESLNTSNLTRIQSMIVRTLTGLSGVTSVVITNQDGSVFKP